MPKKKLKAALYVRVSTEFQKDKDSIPMQLKELHYFALAQGIEDIVEFNDAGFSGKNLERPAVQDMLRRCREGEFTHVLIWKLDRISRNLVDFVELSEELKKYGVTLISKNENFDTSNEIGQAVMKILMIFAELERKMIVMRVKAVMKNRAGEGIWNGGPPPFGYMRQPVPLDENGKEIKLEHPLFPVPDPVEAPIVRKIFEVYAQAGSASKAAEVLKALGLKSREGVWISPSHIIRFISKEFYAGNYRYNHRAGDGTTNKKEDWIICEGTHEAIVDKELWDKCQYIRTHNRNFSREPGQASAKQDRHIFGGYIFCSNCGHSLHANILPSREHPRAPWLASRYDCKLRFNVAYFCDSRNSVSELKLLPWMLKYITRLVQANKHPEKYATEQELMDFLLSGGLFNGAAGIEESAELFVAIHKKVDENKLTYEQKRRASDYTDILIKDLTAKKDKQQRALDRLHKLFLFDDSFMSNEDFAKQQKGIEAEMAKLDKQINDLQRPPEAAHTKEEDEDFLDDFAKFALLQKLNSTKAKLDYYSMVKLIDKKTLRQFMKTIIERVEAYNGRVTKIVFKNGFTSTFKYGK